MRDRADFGFWRDLWDAAEERQQAKDARWNTSALRGGKEGDAAEVRWGTSADEPAVAELLQLNGMPRWVAFEERFIVVEGGGGRLLAAMRYRTGSKRLILGLPIVDPWAGERRMVGELYGGAVELAHRMGLEEVLTRPAGPAKDSQAACLREAGFTDVELFYAAFTWRGWVARAAVT